MSQDILGTSLHATLYCMSQKLHLKMLLKHFSMSGLLHAETHVALLRCGWMNTKSSTLLQDHLQEDRTMESKWASQDGVSKMIHYAGLTSGN